MKRITKIEPARVQAAASKIRVAAYCRVSTEADIQLSSLETQKSHYEKAFQLHADAAVCVRLFGTVFFLLCFFCPAPDLGIH